MAADPLLPAAALALGGLMFAAPAPARAAPDDDHERTNCVRFVSDPGSLGLNEKFVNDCGETVWVTFCFEHAKDVDGACSHRPFPIVKVGPHGDAPALPAWLNERVYYFACADPWSAADERITGGNIAARCAW